MDTSKINSLVQSGWTMAIALGVRVLEALALWIIGRWLIGLALRIIGRKMTRRKNDPTLIRSLQNAYFDTNRVIRDSFSGAGLPTPEQHFMIQTAAAAN